MNYCEWASAYYDDAGRVLKVIEKKKSLLNDTKLNADKRKCIRDAITEYRRIYRDLLKTAKLLSIRGGSADEA